MFPRIANAFSIAAGILGLPALVWQLTGNIWAVVATGSITALVLGIPAISFLIRPKFQRRHGIGYSGNRFIIPKKFERITINPDYSAVVATEKHFIFTEAPAESDLVDTIETLPNDTVDERIYRSTNSSICRVLRKEPSVVAVYWKPNKDIELFAPHIHNSEYNSPHGSEYGPGYFWQGYHCDARTGVCNWRFKCPEDVEEAVAFSLPALQTQITLARLWKFYAKDRRRDCAQPVISGHHREIEWKLVTPKIGKTYICIVIYRGGRQVFHQLATRG